MCAGDCVCMCVCPEVFVCAFAHLHRIQGDDVKSH